MEDKTTNSQPGWFFSAISHPFKGNLPSSGGDQWLAVEMMESGDGCFQKNRGIPKWMVYIAENPIRIHDLGYTPFLRVFSVRKEDFFRELLRLVEVIFYILIFLNLLANNS